MMYGQSQFVRSPAAGVSAPRPPPAAPPPAAPPPAAPPPPPRPPPPCDCGGRMPRDWPVRMSIRVIAPFCDDEYTVVGSSGSIWLKNPSPPPEVTHSLVFTPARSIERDGPHIDPLSCAPPQTL